MAYETIETIANAAARPTPSDGMIRYQQDIQSCIVYDSGASAWKVFTPDAAPYDLDGTNITTTTPLFHFDAGFINGVDTSGNPSDAASLTTDWVSKTKGAAAHAGVSGDVQPVWYASGTNSKPYVLLTADDMLNYGPKSSMEASDEFTVMMIGNKVTSDTTNYLGTAVGTADGYMVWFNYSNGNDYLYHGLTGASSNKARPSIDLSDSNDTEAVMTYVTTRLFLITRDSSDNTDLWVDGNNQNASLDGQYTGDLYSLDIIGGVSYAMSGQLYEYAIWDSDLAAADRNKIIAYVNTKYGAGKGHDGTETLARATF